MGWLFLNDEAYLVKPDCENIVFFITIALTALNALLCGKLSLPQEYGVYRIWRHHVAGREIFWSPDRIKTEKLAVH